MYKQKRTPDWITKYKRKITKKDRHNGLHKDLCAICGKRFEDQETVIKKLGTMGIFIQKYTEYCRFYFKLCKKCNDKFFKRKLS